MRLTKLWKMKTMKNSSDPTGQARNRSRAIRALNQRLNSAKSEVNKLFKSIAKERVSTTKVVNSLKTNEVSFIYQIDAQGLENLSLEIARILDFNLESFSQFVPPNWFYKEFIEVAYRSGALEDFRDVEQALSALGSAATTQTAIGSVIVDATSITSSVVYQRNLASQYAVNYREVKSLSQKTAADVFGEIQRGILAGQNSTTVSREITKRFDVAKSNAKRLAITEINGAYNDSKLDMTEEMEKAFDVSLGNLHISALLPTTRPDHASRHGEAYSSTAQKLWWSSGANRINCYCTTQKVVLDKEGKVLNKELQQEVRKQGDEYFGK